MRENISTILFDLGGVIIELDGPPPLREDWLGGESPISPEEKWLRWGHSEYVQKFETGKISPDIFIEGVIREFGLKVDPDTFREVFVNWPKDFLEGAPELLRSLEPNYRLAFFSNTSELHLPRILKDIALAEYFHHTFASYDIGFFKPDPKGFEHVVKQMNVAACDVLFLDDNMLNVEGARRAGLKAEQVVGVAQAKDVLRNYGCL